MRNQNKKRKVSQIENTHVNVPKRKGFPVERKVPVGDQPPSDPRKVTNSKKSNRPVKSIELIEPPSKTASIDEIVSVLQKIIDQLSETDHCKDIYASIEPYRVLYHNVKDKLINEGHTAILLWFAFHLFRVEKYATHANDDFVFEHFSGECKRARIEIRALADAKIIDKDTQNSLCRKYSYFRAHIKSSLNLKIQKKQQENLDHNAYNVSEADFPQEETSSEKSSSDQALPLASNPFNFFYSALDDESEDESEDEKLAKLLNQLKNG